jgi:16S rRNA (cytosine1402-N4)-methyltransferase
VSKNRFHLPVLLSESIIALDIKPAAVIVDATLGGGGHTQALLNAAPDVKVFSFDQDIDAIQNAIELKKQYGERLTLIHDNFVNLRTRLALEKIKTIDGILFDLGISSHQIDTASRGFSYMRDGKLDMRMDRSIELTAEIIVNNYDFDSLVKVFREYGEERESSRIARVICSYRLNKPITTTSELANIIDKATTSKMKIKARTRIFQALRILINRELDTLETALKDAVNILNPGGRIAVISYSSLEDRVVKKYFVYESKDCICPSSIPVCSCNKIKRLDVHKAIVPGKNDENNIRSRSARLRYATKLGL